MDSTGARHRFLFTGSDMNAFDSQPQPRTLPELLEIAAKRATMSGLALLAPGSQPLEYAGLLEQIHANARFLHDFGAVPQCRIALVLPNGPRMALACLSVLSCCACAPLNPAYQPEEFRFYLEDTQARAVIVERGVDSPVRSVARDLGLPLIEIDPTTGAGQFTMVSGAGMAVLRGAAGGRPLQPDDVALILHTSGTTGRPKIVPLSQANLTASAFAIASWLQLTPADRCLNVMPLFHIHGLVGVLLASLSAGASVVCTSGFEPEAFFPWMHAFAPSWYSAVPTIHQTIIAQAGATPPGTLPRLRFVRSSSASLPPRTFDALQALFEAPVIEAYGMTEASHQLASNPLPPAMRKPGAVGLPTGTQIEIMDAKGNLMAPGELGEIVVRGPGVTAGYERNPGANDKAFVEGWFRTGDQGRFDADGYLVITDRLKDIVNRGGEKVSPREVDEVLLAHPEVMQAVAFAVPHPTLGEDLAAAVVPQLQSTVDEQTLRAYAFGRMAEYKVPSRILVVSAIPKGPTGKMQRAALPSHFAAMLSVAFEAPRAGLEADLATLFEQTLQCPAIGRHDNFFGRGGDSLQGMRLMHKVNARFSTTMPAATLFHHPTPAELATALSAARSAQDEELAAILDEINDLSDDDVQRLLGQP